jgi:hypothetical protein
MEQAVRARIYGFGNLGFSYGGFRKASTSAAEAGF